MDRNFQEHMKTVFSGDIFRIINNLVVPPEKAKDDEDDFDAEWESSLASQNLADFTDIEMYPESVRKIIEEEER